MVGFERRTGAGDLAVLVKRLVPRARDVSSNPGEKEKFSDGLFLSRLTGHRYEGSVKRFCRPRFERRPPPPLQLFERGFCIKVAGLEVQVQVAKCEKSIR